MNITAYPVFRFGANATGTILLRGNPDTAQVTPTVIKLTKPAMHMNKKQQQAEIIPLLTHSMLMWPMEKQ